MNINIKENKKLNGIELYFEKIPTKEIITALKNNSFKWHTLKKCWYNKKTEAVKIFIENLQKNNITNNNKENLQKIDTLWNRTRTEQLKHINTSSRPTNAEIKKFFSGLFPELKISVTQASYCYQCYLRIKEAPYTKDSEQMKAIINLIIAYSNLWSYNNSDLYTDYFDSFDLICNYNIIDYDFKQIEATEDQEADIKNFYIQLTKQKEKEEEQRKIEFEKYLKEQEQARQEAKRQQEEHKKKEQEILENAQITEVTPYCIDNLKWAYGGKNNTISEYMQEITAPQFDNSNDYGTRKEKPTYYLNKAIITKNVNFTNETIYNNFSNMLLTDFDFLNETGGTIINDETNEKYSANCVAVYLNNEFKFVIDAQGYAYSRYVGLPNTIKSQEIDTTPATPEEQEHAKELITRLKNETTIFKNVTENANYIYNTNIETHQIINFRDNPTITDYMVLCINKRNLLATYKKFNNEQDFNNYINTLL